MFKDKGMQPGLKMRKMWLVLSVVEKQHKEKETYDMSFKDGYKLHPLDSKFVTRTMP